MTFRSMIGDEANAHQPLTLSFCRDALRTLVAELEERYLGQSDICERVVLTILVGGSALLEGVPGEGKTTCVTHLSKLAGLRWRRIQLRPDMLPADLLGMRQLTITEGQPDLVWKHGPIYSPIVIADELNRAPPKVQAALLEAMQEKQNSRLDCPQPEPLYHPEDRATLEGLAPPPGQERRKFFDMEVPQPDDVDRVPLNVFATQNPIEQQGVYPLSEAATDRFLFKLLVQRPAIEVGTSILLRNLRRDPPPPRAAEAADGLPLWVKTVCFLDAARKLLFYGPTSVVRRCVTEQQGLWDRVLLVLYLSHYRLFRCPEWESDEDMLPAALRSREQEALSAFVAKWLHGLRRETGGPSDRAELAQRVRAMLEHRFFEYIQTGSSTRGLLWWPMAAAGHALLKNDLGGANPRLKRRHFRAVAQDLLRHRLCLTAQARADHIRSEDIIEMLLDTFLPESATEESDDCCPLLRR